MTLPVPMLGGSTKSFRIRLIDIGVGSKIPEDSDTLEKGKKNQVYKQYLHHMNLV